jgi:hypothetical protein
MPTTDSPARDLIVEECHAVRDMLLEKNKRYGNSALEPLRVFSSASTDEQLRTRIDDKLNRIMNQQLDDDEDAEYDLIGYLILLRIHRRQNGDK